MCAALAVVMLPFAGCSKSSKVAALEVDARLVALDSQWSSGGSIDFDAYAEALDALDGEVHPSNLLWRKARLEVSRGLVSDDPILASAHYTRARDYGVQCLTLETESARLWESGDRAAAVQAHSRQGDSCVIWLSHGWIRWAKRFEPQAVAMDREVMLALGRSLEQMAAPEAKHAWALGENYLGSGMVGSRMLATLAEECAEAGSQGCWVIWEDALTAGADAPETWASVPRPARADDRAAYTRLWDRKP